jgi:UDP-N-acetyl-D-mannosaminuronic acid dehydrogenase
VSLVSLRDRIENKTAKLAVIGLGYVGLPVACEFSRIGFDVVGVDILSERVEKINTGVSPIEGDEPGLDELLNQAIASHSMHATTDYAEVSDRDVILIAVETPVDENNIPRYHALRSVLKSLGPVLKPGALVIIESTIAPGTMRDTVLPMLESESKSKLNSGFYLGNCPERVTPGKLLQNLRTVNRVVGGMTPETAETMVALYQHIVNADLDPTDCLTAELVKTAENAYRDVQIAFANEVALICEVAGGDVWKVRPLVNKSPHRDMHLPGAGVGGHCIPKDPWLLAYGAHSSEIPLRLIPAARQVNQYMPLHMLHLLQDCFAEAGKPLPGSKVLVLGYAYMEDSDDTRKSPSEVFVQKLNELDVEIVIHDPYITEYQGDILELAAGCDAAVVMVRHKAYSQIDLSELWSAMRSQILLDGRRVFSTNLVKQAGFIFRCLGQSPDNTALWRIP